jgi:hypothetical protein
MNATVTPLVRYGEIRKWLRRAGIKEHTLRSAIKAGVIQGRALRKRGRRYYSTAQIEYMLTETLGDENPSKSIGWKREVMADAHPPFMPYGVMRDWLAKWGIRECEVIALIKAGIIQGRALRENGRRYYSTAQIKKDVLDPLLAEVMHHESENRTRTRGTKQR